MTNPNKKKQFEAYVDYLYKKDYKERPATIDELLNSDKFFGSLTNGGKAVYPIWRQKISEVMDEDSKYLVVLTGAIGCLGPDVKVSLLDGSELTIPEIIKQREQGIQHWTYSYDVEKEKLVPGKVVDALLSGNSSKIVEVEFDNGEKIECTDNHPFLLSAGEYKNAGDLKRGDSLAPLYRSFTELGYELSGTHKGKWRCTHTIVAECIYGEVKKGQCVQHKDFVKINNTPENLRKMKTKAHLRYHSFYGNPFIRNPELAREGGRRCCDLRWNGPGNAEERKRASDRLRERNKNGLAKKAAESRWAQPDAMEKRMAYVEEHHDEMIANLKEGSKKRWADLEAHVQFSEKMKEYHKNVGHDVAVCDCCICKGKRGETKGESNPMYGKIPWNKKPRVFKPCLYCGELIECVVGGYSENRKFCSTSCSNKYQVLDKRQVVRNHKVVGVKVLDKNLDVYDLTIEKHHNFALTAGVFVHNTGKTRAAYWGVAAGMNKVLCLRNPYNFFDITAGGKISIVFFNLTKTLSASRGFSLLQSHLLASPWFCERGIIKGNSPNQWLDIPLFDYKIASPYSAGFGTLGEDVLFAVMDEVDDPTGSDKQRERVLHAFDNTLRRLESRFVDDIYKETIGKFFLVASKQDELSFLNTFIAERKNSKSIVVVDIPYWITRPGSLSGKTFSVMVGDVYAPSKVLLSVQEKKSLIGQGYEIIEVPVEYYEAFERDVNGALRDIAGVSVASMRRSKLFPSEKILIDCYDKTKPDPVSMTTILIGLKDNIDILKFVDVNKFRISKSVPRFIHCDIAYSGDGDCLSLAMSGVKHWTKSHVELADGSFEMRKVPVVETDFVFRLKGRPGDQIPLFKMRKFILDLASLGFQIKFTADFAVMSADTKQILERSGIECDYLSLDRDIKPYLTFLDIVTEGRWICHKIDLLHFELKNLEHDREKGKIDHPHKIVEIEFLGDGGTKELVLMGSKDLADGVAGSVYSVLESTDSLPVDEELMKKLLATVQTVSQPGLKENWWLQTNDALLPEAVQYSLRDRQGQYWHWLQEGIGKQIKLTGPFSNNVAGLPPIDVDNPRSFVPGSSAKLPETQTGKFLNILKNITKR